jgi:hypothetical protein
LLLRWRQELLALLLEQALADAGGVGGGGGVVVAAPATADCRCRG